MKINSAGCGFFSLMMTVVSAGVIMKSEETETHRYRYTAYIPTQFYDFSGGRMVSKAFLDCSSLSWCSNSIDDVYGTINNASVIQQSTSFDNCIIDALNPRGFYKNALLYEGYAKFITDQVDKSYSANNALLTLYDTAYTPAYRLYGNGISSQLNFSATVPLLPLTYRVNSQQINLAND